MNYSIFKKLIILFCFTISVQCGISEETETKNFNKEENNKEFYFYLENAKRFQKINPDSAHYYAKKAIEIASAKNDEFLRAEILNADAITYASCNNIVKGLNIFKEVYRIYDKPGKEKELSEVMSNIAICYEWLNQYDSSIFYLFSSINMKSAENDTIGLMKSFHNIGNVFSKLGDYKKSNDYYQKAYEFAVSLNDKHEQIELINNIGLNYRFVGNYDSALCCFNEYLDYYSNNPNPLSLGMVYNNLGLVYQDINKKNKATSCYKMSINNLEKIGHKWGIANAYHNMAQVYNNNNMLDSAIFCSKQSALIIDSLDYPELNRDIYKTLYEAYQKKGNSIKALRNYKNYIAFKDTVFNLEKARLIEELETKYETSKKEIENQKLKSELKISEIRQEKIFLISAVIIVLLLAIVLVVLLMRKNIIHKHELSLKESIILKERLDFSNQELASKALHLASQNEFRTKMLDKISNIYDHVKESGRKNIKMLLHDLENNINENAWKEFETRFEQVHKSFFDEINRKFPGLTPNDRRLCAFLKLNMTTKDIALLTHRSPRSIESARYRLRKKFGLAPENDISKFLQSI
ncbi:MAG: tetratricopeptide repeat protein [Bacteroidales bacterium]|nr:tetratricopeptide repeat protein [Bacteroidales bacterium]